MHRYSSFLPALVVLLFAALPAWAARTYSTHLTIINPYQIAGHRLRPGTYKLKVKSAATRLSVLHHGRLVASVPVRWQTLTRKPHHTEVISDHRQVQQIRFHNQKMAVQINSKS